MSKGFTINEQREEGCSMKKDEQVTKGSQGTCGALTDQGVVPQDLSVWAEEISQESFSLLSKFAGKGTGRSLAKELGWKQKG